MKSWLPPVVLLVLAGAFFLLDLGTLGLTDVDEGKNAEAAREMVESGDWISPSFDYEPRYKKPVFIYWLIGLAYRSIGTSEFAARLPSALCAIGLVLVQFLFLRRLRGETVALLGGLMLLLNIQIVAVGRIVTTDSVLILFTTLSLYGFWLGFHGQGSQRYFLWLFYVCMGLAVLTKGPIGLLVPGLVLVPYLTLTRRWRQFRERGGPVLGSLVTLSLAVPWYAAMLAIHGSKYWDTAYSEMAGRFFTTLEGHGGTVFFYVPILLFGFFPWSAFLPAALYQTVTGWWADRASAQAGGPERPDELELFAAIWVAGVFLFFSASSTRLPHYIAPLFPAASLLAACYWHRAIGRPETPGFRGSIHLMMISGYLMGLALASVPTLYAKFVDLIAKEFPAAHQVDPGLSPVVCGAILVVGSSLIGYFGFSDTRRAGTLWAAGATIGLVMLIVIEIGVPRYSTFFIKPPQELAYIASLNLKPEDRLIYYGSYRPSLVFYSRRKSISVHPGQEDRLLTYLRRPGRTMILLRSDRRSALPAEVAALPVILERYGYSLLANEPMIKEPPATRTPAPPANPHPVNPHGGY